MLHETGKAVTLGVSNILHVESYSTEVSALADRYQLADSDVLRYRLIVRHAFRRACPKRLPGPRAETDSSWYEQ